MDSEGLQLVEKLKSRGDYFAAGALAGERFLNRHYGCHFGMKSEYVRAARLFYAGFDAAQAVG